MISSSTANKVHPTIPLAHKFGGSVLVANAPAKSSLRYPQSTRDITVRNDIISLLATGKCYDRPKAHRVVVGLICIPACTPCLLWSSTWRILTYPLKGSITEENACTTGSDRCLVKAYKSVCDDTPTSTSGIHLDYVLWYVYDRMAPLRQNATAWANNMPKLTALHTYLETNGLLKYEHFTDDQKQNGFKTVNDLFAVLQVHFAPKAEAVPRCCR